MVTRLSLFDSVSFLRVTELQGCRRRTFMNATNLCVEPVSLANQQTYDDGSFPLVLQCRAVRASRADALEWVGAHHEELDQKATTHGAILFRGFPLGSAEDFDAFAAAMQYPNFAYDQSMSNAVRVNRTERVFTANEAPADVTIYLHHEMAQTPIFPSKLLFFCEKPAETGGATPICRSDVLLERLAQDAPQFVHDCRCKGLKYTNVMPPQADLASGMGRSWQSTLSAESRAAAENRLRHLGYSWQWLEDGSLRTTTPVMPAVRDLPTGRKSFFNQLIAASQGWKDSRNDPSKSITHGDGTPLDRGGVMLAAQLAEAITFDIPWEQGDVALVDNYVTMHGRRAFTGTRKVLASLVAADLQ